MVHPVTIVDVAPRDGLQSDGLVVSTEAKLALIERIVRAGITRVEATSFVNPTRVPQMADAAEVMAGLAARRADLPPEDPMQSASFIGLVLNRRGLDRALEAGCDEVNAVVLGSEFGQQVHAMFERDLAASDAVTLAQWHRRTLDLRVKEWLSRLWEYWL